MLEKKDLKAGDSDAVRRAGGHRGGQLVPQPGADSYQLSAFCLLVTGLGQFMWLLRTPGTSL